MGDPTGTVTGRSQETRNTTSPISSRRSVRRRRTSWVSTTDLYEMEKFEIIWLKLVEPKIFVDKWWSFGRKLTIIKVIGGFVRTRLVPIQCQSSTDLTSNKHCLYFVAVERKRRILEPTMDTKLFFVLVELASIVLESLFLRKSPWSQGNLVNK